MPVPTPMESTQPSSPPTAAVAIPAYKTELSADEVRSLRQVTAVLGAHPIRFTAPEGLDVAPYLRLSPDATVVRFPPTFYGSGAANNRLMMSATFYEAFRDVDFVLVFHLDAWVFRDELLHWAGAGYDYLGPPWFEGFDEPAPDAPFLGVGNGGFTLRRVASHLEIARVLDRGPAWGRSASVYRARSVLRRATGPLAARLGLNADIRRRLLALYHRGYDANEDWFWGIRVPQLLPEFRVPDLADAARFAFEVQPRRLQALTGQLPFGCHGWPRYDREFWESAFEA